LARRDEIIQRQLQIRQHVPAHIPRYTIAFEIFRDAFGALAGHQMPLDAFALRILNYSTELREVVERMFNWTICPSGAP